MGCVFVCRTTSWEYGHGRIAFTAHVEGACCGSAITVTAGLFGFGRRDALCIKVVLDPVLFNVNKTLISPVVSSYSAQVEKMSCLV